MNEKNSRYEKRGSVVIGLFLLVGRVKCICFGLVIELSIRQVRGDKLHGSRLKGL